VKLPDVANVLRCRILFTIAEKPTQGVRLFMRWAGTSPSAAALVALAEDLYNALVGATIATVMGTSTKLTEVILEDLTSATGNTGSYAHTTTGTRAGDALPADAAFVSSYEITRRYRGGHARSYWPFGTADDLTTRQTFKSASVTSFETVVADAIAAFTGHASGGCTIGVQVNVSYYEGFTVVTSPTTGRARNVPKLRDTPVVGTVLSITGRSYVGSFRRRRFKTS